MVQIGKGEHHRGSIFWPGGSLLPGAIFLRALRLSLIAAPVALLEIYHMQAYQVLLQSLANQRRSIHLLPLRRDIGGLQKLCIQNDLYGSYCGILSTAYSTVY